MLTLDHRWNFLAWIFGAASMTAIIANQIISMYGLYHVDTCVFQRWHVYVTYLIVTWICCSIVLSANRALTAVNQLGLFSILAGVFITIIVCAAVPGGEEDQATQPHILCGKSG